MSNTETVVRALFTDMSEGKLIEAVQNNCADHCVWENSGLPTANNKQEMLAMMQQFIDGFNLKAIVVDLHHYAVTGNTMLTERVDHMDDPQGNRMLSFPLAGILTVENNKIVRWSDYFDPRPLLPADAS